MNMWFHVFMPIFPVRVHIAYQIELQRAAYEIVGVGQTCKSKEQSSAKFQAPLGCGRRWDRCW